MQTAATYGLTHLAIAVSNLEKTRNFYQAVFDMQLMYHTPEMIQLTTPGCNDIIVFERNAELAGKQGGVLHFGFRLRAPEEFGRVYDRLVQLGVKIIDTGEFVAGSPYVFFTDPDGYVVEVWFEVLQ